MTIKRRLLNKDKVTEAAAQLVNEVGSFEAITLAQLAERLDIKVPSLYNHIKGGTDELRRDLTLYGVEGMYYAVSTAAIGRSTDDAIYAIADAYRAYAVGNPGIYPLLLAAPDPADEELVAAADRLLTVLINVLAAYDLQDDDALHAVRAFRAVVHGFVSIEMGGGYALPLDRDESFRRVVAMFLGSLEIRK